MLNILNIFLPIILLALTGLILRHFFLKSDGFWNNINNLLYYFLLPIFLLQGILKSDIKDVPFSQLVIVIILATFIIMLLLYLLKFIFNINGDSFSSVFQGSIRYNSYILVALYPALLPNNGVAFLGVISIFMIVFTNLASIMVLTLHCKKNKKFSLNNFFLTLIKNPLILAVISGFILNIFKIELPTAIDHYLVYLTNSVTTISLLSIGAGLKVTYDMLEKIKLIILSLSMKLLLLPSLVLLFLHFIPVSNNIKMAAILYASVPCAANSYVLSKNMHGDYQLMAAIVFSGISLGMLTMPLFIYLIQM